MHPPLTFSRKYEQGISIVELLTLATMCTIVIGFVVMHFVRGNRTNHRTSSSTELANYLRRARHDSMARKPTDIDQMAQVKVFNGRYYSVAIDANSDSYLDIPLVMRLPTEQGLQIQGPFPKTFIFDGSGQTVDSTKRRLPSPPVIVGDNSGATALTFSESGEVQVIPAIKVTASR
ncbi:MAG: hypothetical protein AABN95_00460 [Acidobacteriota bacterium]